MNRLKSIIVALLLSVTIVGCITSSNPDMIGYQRGRRVAVAYMLTDGVQPAELRLACITGYNVLTRVCETHQTLDIDDSIVEDAIIKSLGKPTTPEEIALVKNFYTMAKNRMLSELPVNPFEIDSGKLVPAYLKNFKAGIDDALNDYGYTK